MNMKDVALKLSEMGDVVSRSEIANAFRISGNALNRRIWKLKNMGLITDSGKRGVYFINFHLLNKFLIHPYALANLVVKPSAVAYWSALDYHGWSNRSPGIVYVETPVHRNYTNTKKIGGLTVAMLAGFYFKPVTIKKEKFFGFVEAKIHGRNVLITDREKTILDCVEKPKYAGTVEELFDALRNAEFDENKLLSYVLRFNNKTLIKRLGFISEILGWGIEKDLLRMLTRKDRRTYPLLYPSGPNVGKFNYKWGLRINISPGFWRETKW